MNRYKVIALPVEEPWPEWNHFIYTVEVSFCEMTARSILGSLYLRSRGDITIHLPCMMMYFSVNRLLQSQYATITSFGNRRWLETQIHSTTP